MNIVKRKRKNGFIRETKQDRVFNIVNGIILGIIAICMIYPLWFIVSASISDPTYTNLGKMLLIPKNPSFEGYKRVLSDKTIFVGYRNTIIYTFLGTILNLCVTLPAAYALSRSDFVGNKFFTIMFLITMFFSGGLIPTYLIVKAVGLYNSPLAMIILGATSMTNIIISRTFFKSTIPTEMQEAAQIDGCGNVRLFFQIVLPLSSAIIAVMALFFAVGHWNSYFNAMIYIRKDAYKPLQVILRQILLESQYNAEMVLQGLEGGALRDELKIAEQLNYALIVVSSLPVIIMYPFIQRYFVKGVTVGAVKG